MSWRYVDGCAAGTSHLETRTPCQDRCVCAVVDSRDGGEVFVTVLSDGAGSAARCEDGAETVCAKLLELVREALAQSSDLDALGDELVRSWFLEVRESIRRRAREDGFHIREYAATALLAVASDHQALCAQIGDGGIVLRRAPGEPFEVAIWPEGGEYANETFFITDDGAPERIALRRYDYVHDLVAFSDGLQYLALEHATRSAFRPFFEPLVETVRGLAGSDGAARESLLAFLSSDTLNERTNDDKALAVGCRIVPTTAVCREDLFASSQ